MPIVKKRDHQTEFRLLLESGEPVDLPPAERTFWVKLWHTAGSDLTKIERVQVISCLPSTRGTNVIIGDES